MPIDEESGLKDSTKQCLPIYSQSNMQTIGWKSLKEGWTFGVDEPLYEDLKHNGMYCEYGLAFPISQTESKCS